MKIVLIGAGQRGRIYADYMKESKNAQVVAIVEPHEGRRNAAANALEVAPQNCFTDVSELFALGKIADAVIIASMDLDHYQQVIAAIQLGYHILLEKPVSPNPQECVKIANMAEKKGVHIVVCHVLRYTAFFSTIKEVLDSGRLGKIMSIQHNENIGNFHMAHSFVRGNWRNSELSSPIIMQKSCHDMDILVWLVGSNCKKMVSFGQLKHFTPQNAPKGSAEYCVDCKIRESCRFDAEKSYMPARTDWPATVVTQDQTEDGLKKALEHGQFGRCVYHCDNNVCDTQGCLIEFENGVTVNFTLSAFTNKMCRTLKIMCEHGEIRATDASNTIEIIPFSSNQCETVREEIIVTATPIGGHGGGDRGIIEDFCALLNGTNTDSRSSIRLSIESHLMAHAAEKSRFENCIVDMQKLKKDLSENI